MALSITMLCHYAECHYAECHYAVCHNAECRYAEWCHTLRAIVSAEICHQNATKTPLKCPQKCPQTTQKLQFSNYDTRQGRNIFVNEMVTNKTEMKRNFSSLKNNAGLTEKYYLGFRQNMYTNFSHFE
jgi:hypothetical protein